MTETDAGPTEGENWNTTAGSDFGGFYMLNDFIAERGCTDPSGPVRIGTAF